MEHHHTVSLMQCMCVYIYSINLNNIYICLYIYVYPFDWQQHCPCTAPGDLHVDFCLVFQVRRCGSRVPKCLAVAAGLDA